MRKGELSLETMTPVGRNDSMCTNVFWLHLNDSRYAAVLIGLYGLQGKEGARANVIMHAPKPQTMHGLRDLGSHSAATPGFSATASFASGFSFFSSYYATVNKRQLWRPRSSVATAPVLLSWKVAFPLRKKWWTVHDSTLKSVFSAHLYQCKWSKVLTEHSNNKGSSNFCGTYQWK